jgi:MerR family transcriptional regulator, light-induced transcriptional regulator
MSVFSFCRYTTVQSNQSLPSGKGLQLRPAVYTVSLTPVHAVKQTHWSIADVERETGLGKDTLRVWERRYGFPSPSRDSQGDRSYDWPQLAQLRLIKRLLESGFRPGKVVPLSMEAMYALLPGLDASPPAARATVRAHKVQPPAGEPWLDWLKNDRVDELRSNLRRHLLRHGLASTIEQLIAPLGVQVGEAWLSGQLSVYQEHMFTETVQTLLREALATMRSADPSAARAPRVVLATLPRERHALGLLMAEAFLGMEGCDCRPLGVDTPVSEIVLAAQAMRADVVALSLSLNAPTNDALNGLKQLRSQLPANVALWVGGRAPALQTRRVPAGVHVLAKAHDVVEEVAQWRARRADDTVT